MKDKEAQEITEFAELLYNFREAMDIKTIKANIESFLLANHYTKLPKDKPPLLSDEGINSAFDGAFDQPVDFDHKPTPEEIILVRLRAVAQAQREICV